MALNGTMVAIQTVTVPSGGQAAIEFLNIPQTYTDLKIVISGRSSSTPAEGMYIAFNGSTANFSGRYLLGDGVNTSSASLARYVGSIFGAVGTASTFNNTEIYIPNYTSSTNKSFSVDNVAENNATTGFQNLIAGLWSNTAAITSISITCTGFVQHSTATLYGISRTTAQIKATGGMVYDDESFVYHLFTSSGTFTPSSNLTCDVLVIAGGGGGGSYRAGGGGAGGLLAFTSQGLIAQNYTVTIGAGGTGAVQSGSSTSGSVGTNGSDSQFGSLTLVKGGGRGGAGEGAGQNHADGANGGSGGGAAAKSAGSTGGTPQSGQGTNGGNGGWGSNYFAAGGGGGAGVAGTNGSASTGGGAGGNGSSAYSSWGEATSTGQNINGTRWYAGGGAGGAFAGLAATNAVSGGNGGGGSLPAVSLGGNASGVAGSANTGGGGAGSVSVDVANQHGTGGNGGSGIVIVRYAK